MYIIYGVFMLVAKCGACIGSTGGGGVSTQRRTRRLKFLVNYLAISSIGGLFIVTRGLSPDTSVIRRFQYVKSPSLIG
jgi:hypothetical protein